MSLITLGFEMRKVCQGHLRAGGRLVWWERLAGIGEKEVKRDRKVDGIRGKRLKVIENECGTRRRPGGSKQHLGVYHEYHESGLAPRAPHHWIRLLLQSSGEELKYL